MKKPLLATALAIVLSGCAGTSINWNDARQLRAGMTEAEVTELVGRPYAVTSRGQDQIWIWSHANGMTGSSQSMSVVMRGGRLVDAPTIPEAFR